MSEELICLADGSRIALLVGRRPQGRNHRLAT